MPFTTQSLLTDEFMGLGSKSQQTYCYDYEATSAIERMSRPDLQFTAPELISSVGDTPISGAADVFSLACVVYRVLRKQSLFTARNTSEYRNMISSLHLIPVDGLPSGLQVRYPSYFTLPLQLLICGAMTKMVTYASLPVTIQVLMTTS